MDLISKDMRHFKKYMKTKNEPNEYPGAEKYNI